MSWGQPKCASIFRPMRSSCNICSSVSACLFCRSGSISCAFVPPSFKAEIASFLLDIFFSKACEEAGDLFMHVGRDGYPFDDPANLTTQFTDFLPVFHLEKR